jgi:hypothetical protein
MRSVTCVPIAPSARPVSQRKGVMSGHAMAWLRALLHRLHVVISWLPRLRDAFTSDDFPISFVIRRDSREVRPIDARRRRLISGSDIGLARNALRVPMERHRGDARSTLRRDHDRR